MNECMNETKFQNRFLLRRRRHHRRSLMTWRLIVILLLLFLFFFFYSSSSVVGDVLCARDYAFQKNIAPEISQNKLIKQKKKYEKKRKKKCHTHLSCRHCCCLASRHRHRPNEWMPKSKTTNANENRNVWTEITSAEIISMKFPFSFIFFARKFRINKRMLVGSTLHKHMNRKRFAVYSKLHRNAQQNIRSSVQANERAHTHACNRLDFFATGNKIITNDEEEKQKGEPKTATFADSILIIETSSATSIPKTENEIEENKITWHLFIMHFMHARVPFSRFALR